MTSLLRMHSTIIITKSFIVTSVGSLFSYRANHEQNMTLVAFRIATSPSAARAMYVRPARGRVTLSIGVLRGFRFGSGRDGAKSVHARRIDSLAGLKIDAPRNATTPTLRTKEASAAHVWQLYLRSWAVRGRYTA